MIEYDLTYTATLEARVARTLERLDYHGGLACISKIYHSWLGKALICYLRTLESAFPSGLLALIAFWNIWLALNFLLPAGNACLR
jgi:hypothetical protein